MRREYRALCLGAWLPSVAAAQPPVHVAVVPVAEDGPDGVVLAGLVRDALEASGRYRVAASCDDCVATAAGRGLDQLVFVEQVDVRTVGVRVLDVATGAERRDLAPFDGALDADLLDRLFFGRGTVVVSGAPPDARLLLDGRALAVVGEARFESLPAGKHTFVLSAEGREEAFFAVLVQPDMVVTVPGALRSLNARPKTGPQVLVVGLGLGLVGAIGIAATAGGPAVAVRAP